MCGWIIDLDYSRGKANLTGVWAITISVMELFVHNISDRTQILDRIQPLAEPVCDLGSITNVVGSSPIDG